MGLHKILWLRGLVFTVLVPGSVGLYLPKALASGHKQAEGPASYAGWALVLSGVAVYAVCLGHFLRAGGTPAIFFARRLRLLIGEEPSRLVAGGLYAFSRNPMYVGVLLAIFGQALLYRSGTLAIYGAIVWTSFHVVIITVEEPHLRATLGQAYLETAARCRAGCFERHEK